MSKKQVDYYNQCVLVRAGVKERIVQVSWLPTQYAGVGRLLSLKNSKGEWNDWNVENAGPPMDAAYIEQHKDDHRDYIKNTDI